MEMQQAGESKRNEIASIAVNAIEEAIEQGYAEGSHLYDLVHEVVDGQIFRTHDQWVIAYAYWQDVVEWEDPAELFDDLQTIIGHTAYRAVWDRVYEEIDRRQLDVKWEEEGGKL